MDNTLREKGEKVELPQHIDTNSRVIADLLTKGDFPTISRLLELFSKENPDSLLLYSQVRIPARLLPLQDAKLIYTCVPLYISAYNHKNYLSEPLFHSKTYADALERANIRFQSNYAFKFLYEHDPYEAILFNAIQLLLSIGTQNEIAEEMREHLYTICTIYDVPTTEILQLVLQYRHQYNLSRREIIALSNLSDTRYYLPSKPVRRYSSQTVASKYLRNPLYEILGVSIS